MKKMKKVLAMLLSFIMMMSMAMTTFAAPGTAAKLTVTNVPTGQTVYLYKLLNVEKTSAEVGKETYEYSLDDANTTINAAVKTALNIQGAKMTAEDVYNAVNAMDKTQIAELARKLVSAIGVNAATNSKAATGTTTVSFDALTDGYYLIYSPNTVSAIKTVVGADNTVALKSNLPIVDKDSNVKPNEGAVIGQVIDYTVKTTVPNIAGFDTATYVFKLTDTLTEGLDFVTNAEGKIVVNYSITGTDVKGTINAIPSLDNARMMVVDLKDVIVANQQHEGKELVLTYQAKVNSNAVVDNHNEAKIEYSNDPTLGTDHTTTTTPDKEFTPTYELLINKTASDTKKYLAGAVFELHKDTEDGTVIKVEGSNGVYHYAADQDKTTTTEMTTVGNKVNSVNGTLGNYNLSINGLKAGTYYLVEKTAPEGYNKVKAIKIVITGINADEGVTAGDYTVTVNDEAKGDKIVDVVNKKGALLPETGGMGTIVFTVAAIVLILGVVVSFVFSRRKDRR